MSNVQSQTAKPYRLEARTFNFAKECRMFIGTVPRTISNIEDCKQLARSSGSVGANYIEANEALSKKDFVMRVKICRKEAKESIMWLNLLSAPEDLVDEATQLMKIFGSILEKSNV